MTYVYFFNKLCVLSVQFLLRDFIVGTCEASRFDSNSNQPFRFDLKVMGRFENFRIGRTCHSQSTQIINGDSGTVYRLASYKSDHTLVLF